MTHSISTALWKNDEMLYKDIFQWLTVTHFPSWMHPFQYACPYANLLILRSKENKQEERLAFSDIKSLVEGQFALTIIQTSQPLRRQSMFNVALYNTVPLQQWQIFGEHLMNNPKLRLPFLFAGSWQGYQQLKCSPLLHAVHYSAIIQHISFVLPLNHGLQSHFIFIGNVTERCVNSTWSKLWTKHIHNVKRFICHLCHPYGNLEYI